MSTSERWGRLYWNVSVIDCESKETLDELLATLGLEQLVVRRLSDRTVVVDGRQKATITRALARRRSPYRVVDLPPALPDQRRSGRSR